MDKKQVFYLIEKNMLDHIGGQPVANSWRDMDVFLDNTNVVYYRGYWKDHASFHRLLRIPTSIN